MPKRFGTFRILALVLLAAAPAPAGEAAISAPPDRTIRRIVLDAGHGGKDGGAVSRGGEPEKLVALEVTRLLRDELSRRGFDVVMTRDSDTFVPLAGRARAAMTAKADLFVSIHANASDSKSLRGFEVYTLAEEVDDGMIALRRAAMSPERFVRGEWRPSEGVRAVLWDLVQTENRRESVRLARLIGEEAEERSIGPQRRLRDACFYVLKWSETPAVLVELGYLTNAQDERLLKSAIHRRKLVESVANGVARFAAEFESTKGYVRA